MCMQNFDFMGDHASCCAKNSDLIIRHNRIRNLLNKICTEGQLSPVMEKKGILGIPTNQVGDLVTLRFPIGNKDVVWQLMWR